MAVMVPRELRGSPVGRRGDCESGRPRAPGRSSDGAGRPAGWSGRRHCLRECCPGNGVPVAGRALSRTYVTCDHHVSVGLIAAVGADFQPVESGHSAGAPDPPFTDFYEPLFDEVLFVSQARIAFNTSRHAEPPVSMDVVLPVTAARCARRLAGIAAEPRGRATPRQLFRTGALPKDDHGSVDCHALAEAFPTVPARTTARGTAPREAVATTAVQTRTAPGPPRGLRPPPRMPRSVSRTVTSPPEHRGGQPEQCDAVLRRRRFISAMRPSPNSAPTSPGPVGLRARAISDRPTPRRLAQWLSAAQARPRPKPQPFPPASRKD